MTEDKMVGWHHRLNGHKFEQAQGDCEGQGILACYSPWGHDESDITTQRVVRRIKCIALHKVLRTVQSRSFE